MRAKNSRDTFKKASFIVHKSQKDMKRRLLGRFFGIFSQIMGERDQTELDRDLLKGSQSEALEAVVELDLPEDRFRFYRPQASLPEALVAVEQFPRPGSQLVVAVVDLNGSRPLSPVAQSPHRTSLAAFGSVYAHR